MSDYENEKSRWAAAAAALPSVEIHMSSQQLFPPVKPASLFAPSVTGVTITGLEPFPYKQLTPKNPKYFKKRTCICFVEQSKDNLCAGCNRPIEKHARLSGDKKWTYEKCTILETTDAYGILKFRGSYTKEAKFIRAQTETRGSDMIQFMFHDDGWGMRKPNLILSITGGAQKFSLPYMVKKAFKQGLVKAAASTGAWIITGGTNAGVMKLVGDAVADEGRKYGCDFTVLGVASWGKIALRNQMIDKREFIYGKHEAASNSSVSTKSVDDKRSDFKITKPISSSVENKDPTVNDPLLDPNHTHFILVDDGSDNKFGIEIPFRARLESELRRGKSLKYYEQKNRQRSQRSLSSREQKGFNDSNDASDLNVDSDEVDNTVPMILIVVQGGPNTLKTVTEAICKKIPILILVDSKGCADLIADALSVSDPTDTDLEECVRKSEMFAKEKNLDLFRKKVSDAAAELKTIVSVENKGLINVFHFNSQENYDMEMSILRALLKSRHNEFYENLKLSMYWNRDDVAKEYIFTGEEEFKEKELDTLMEIALLENKPKFVEMLLENGLNLNKFLTDKRLNAFYNLHENKNLAKKSPFFRLYCQKFSKSPQPVIRINDVKRFLRFYLFKGFKTKFLDEVFTGLNEKVPYPEKNLLVWSLLMNRIDIAKIFWRVGQHQVSTGLFSSNLLRSMSKHLPDLESEMLLSANEFEDMACSVVKMIDETPTNTIANSVLLRQKSPYYNLDCLELAFEGGCMNFFSLTPVQNLLTNIWNGNSEVQSGIKASFKFLLSCMSFGLLSPFLIRFQIEGSTENDIKRLMLKRIKRDRKFRAKKMPQKQVTASSDSAISSRETITPIKPRDPNFRAMVKKRAKSITTFSTGNMGTLTDMIRRQQDAIGTVTTTGESSDDFAVRRNLDSGDAGDLSDAPAENVKLNLQRRNTRVESSDSDDDYDHHLQNTSHLRRSWKKKLVHIYKESYVRFIKSPRVIFFYEIFFFTSFLLIYSYWLLCKLNYYELHESYADDDDDLIPLINETTTANNMISINKTVGLLKKRGEKFRPSKLHPAVVNPPSFVEYLLIYWVSMFMVEELVQFMFSDREFSVMNKLFKYFSSSWNYLDQAGCILFLVGICLRFLSIILHDEDIFKAAKILFATDLTVWFIRLLHVALVFKNLGPKLVMIQKMIHDLTFFLVIIAVFVFTFAITTQATMYSNNEMNMRLLKKLIDKAYWPIFGELRILDEINLEQCMTPEQQAQDANCPSSSGIIYSYLFLMVYIIIANVLLINLLIAMFSSTFQLVQDNTDKIWKYQRYGLVFEYVGASLFSPPINLISYLISSIKFVKSKLSRSEEKSDYEAINEDVLVLEKTFAEEYTRRKLKEEDETLSNRVKSNSDKLDFMEQKLAEIGSYKADLLEAINMLVESNNNPNDSMTKEFKRLNSSFRSIRSESHQQQQPPITVTDPTKLLTVRL